MQFLPRRSLTPWSSATPMPDVKSWLSFPKNLQVSARVSLMLSYLIQMKWQKWKCIGNNILKRPRLKMTTKMTRKESSSETRYCLSLHRLRWDCLPKMASWRNVSASHSLLIKSIFIKHLILIKIWLSWSRLRISPRSVCSRPYLQQIISLMKWMRLRKKITTRSRKVSWEKIRL